MVSKPVIIIDSSMFKSWFTSVNLQKCEFQTTNDKKLDIGRNTSIKNKSKLLYLTTRGWGGMLVNNRTRL